jgi:hypothetical protein
MYRENDPVEEGFKEVRVEGQTLENQDMTFQEGNITVSLF